MADNLIERSGFTPELIDYFNGEDRRQFKQLVRDMNATVDRLPSGVVHRDRRASREERPTLAERERRSTRFNQTTGVVGYWSESGPTGAYHHPDKCICQGTDPTPHKHYPDAPFSCARCGHAKCSAYKPAWPESGP